MFNLARIQLPAPVTLLLPTGRPRVVPGQPVPLTSETGAERCFDRFDGCFTTNPTTRTIHAEIPPIPHAMLIYGPADFAAGAADTPEQHAARVLQLLGTDPETTLQALINGEPLAAPVARIPREVELWQAKAVMTAMGMISQVEAALHTLPEPQRAVVLSAWDGNARLARNGATVTTLAAALGLTPGQVDGMFVTAGALTI